LMYDIPGMYVGILASGIIGYAANLLLLFLEKHVIHWKGEH